jgi:hypothetical protein
MIADGAPPCYLSCMATLKAAKKAALTTKPRAAKAVPTRRATAAPVDVQNTIGLSIRQPYVEEILRGLKRVEYRTRATNIRGRVLIYASLQPGNPSRFAKLKVEPGGLPTGVVVGSVEITDCTGTPGDYQWHLAKPRRIKRPMPPRNRPQPGWFYPFRRDKLP